jgi:hypothetical protein
MGTWIVYSIYFIHQYKAFHCIQYIYIAYDVGYGGMHLRHNNKGSLIYGSKLLR